MYVIWNDHIWSASTSYRRRDYLHGSCNSPRTARPPCCATATTCTSSAEPSGSPGQDELVRQAQHPEAGPWNPPRPRRPRRSRTPAATRRRTADEEAPEAFPDGILDLRSVLPSDWVPVDGGTVETRFSSGGRHLLADGRRPLRLRRPRTRSRTPSARGRRATRPGVPQPSRRARRRFGRFALSVNGEPALRRGVPGLAHLPHAHHPDQGPAPEAPAAQSRGVPPRDG